jgi:hypothetical protein
MTSFRFPYNEYTHPLFGTFTQPAIRLDLYAETLGRWLRLYPVLADTGADISVAPLMLGQALVVNVQHGAPIHLGGRAESGEPANAFVHQVLARIDNLQFELPLAIALSPTIPIIFGRYNALDRFTVRFDKGNELVLET